MFGSVTYVDSRILCDPTFVGTPIPGGGTTTAVVSGGEVNWLIDGFGGERLPTINLAHIDLAGGEQRPEQHRGRVC